MESSAAIRRVSSDRLRRNFQAIAAIGALAGGGCERLAYSPEERAAHAEFRRLAEAAGLTVWEDAIGNSFARLEPAPPDDKGTPGKPAQAGGEAPAGSAATGGARADDAARGPVHGSYQAILTGSHLDTVARGGCFDGAAGVLCSLEAVIALAEAQAAGEIALSRPVEVVAWANEEGARFAPAMMGSAVYAGVMSLETARASRDSAGVGVAEALDNARAATTTARAPHLPASPPAAYLELHIEQGVELEAAEIPVAVVEGVQAQIAGDWLIAGRSAHAGATPMHRRSDALVSATALISETPRIAEKHNPGVATVGSLSVAPGSRNSVPGEVRGTIDLRHPEESSVANMLDAFLSAGKRAADESKCYFEFTELWRAPRVAFDQRLLGILDSAASEAGIETMRLFSAAGHDAVNIAAVAPAAMLFVPSVGGVSHHPEEETPMEALVAGARLLAAALLKS